MPRRILVIDDNPMLRDLEAIFLAGTGQVITAGGGEEGLELARRDPPDVMVVDLDMPDLPGDRLCRVIKSDPDLRDVPVVLITSADDPADRERSVRAGADDVLAKPINRISLIQAVSRFISHSEIRGLKRVPMIAAVTLDPSGSGCVGISKNVSRGGMQVEFESSWEAGSEVELRFDLPESEEQPAPLCPTAKVVWRRHDGRRSAVGLQFLSLDGNSARRIDDFVYERSQSTETS